MNRCASCAARISPSAEWCCEPCANGQGHADTCRHADARRVREHHTTPDESE